VTGHHPGSLRVPAPGDATGIPLDSPLTGLPPSRFRDGEIVTFQYATEPEAIRALLPAPLELVNDTVQVQGQPKRIAEVTLETLGDLHIGRVRHNGIDIFTGTMQYKASPSTADRLRSRVDPVTNINLKVINHIDGRPAIRQLTARDLTGLTVSECYEGPCTAEIRPSATAPLYRLPARTFLEGFYWRCDFTLAGGRILHDYL
jgi:acetoacetate decarboxylase